MAWTQDDLDQIDRALAAGNLSVRIGDRVVQKYSVKELVQIRNMIAGAVGVTPIAESQIGVQYVTTSKGLL